MEDSKTRSLVKGLSWRGVASIATMAIAYGLTGDVEVMVTIGAADVVAKLVLYYFHERFWTHLKWGKVRVTED